jgi:NAD(P)-dependent dehydrogenase (short-subunit alcohol dehydrogenase family)
MHMDHEPGSEECSERPSPRPSPGGRGRIFPAGFEGLSRVLAGTSRDGSDGWSSGMSPCGICDTLSPRERVGVREPVSTLAIAAMERFMDATMHPFYDQLCPACAAFNFTKRTELADLRGRVALLTGGRVKIGYQAGIKLLRCRRGPDRDHPFPRDSALRYAAEPDFKDWGHRLEIFGLDLRHTPSVEAFCRHLQTTRSRLDFIINNACQTVRRPPEFYEHMMEQERASVQDMPDAGAALLGSYEGLRGYHMLRRSGSFRGRDGSVAARGVRDRRADPRGGTVPGPLAARGTRSPEAAVSRGTPRSGPAAGGPARPQFLAPDLMAEVSSVELLEVQLVNAIAPFVLNARLKPLMLRTPERDKHIVNVSAVEGQFYRKFKTTRHPHTNMAKAALNMMTRTSAADYHARRHPHERGGHRLGDRRGSGPDRRAQAPGARFHPPLDIVDGAARIVDPIITASTPASTCGASSSRTTSGPPVDGLVTNVRPERLELRDKGGGRVGGERLAH